MAKQNNSIQLFFHKASNNRGLYVFLFCLLLASFFWLLNALSNEFTTDITFKALYINQPKDKIVINDLPTNYTIKVKALGFDLLSYKMSLKYPELVIDLSRLKELNATSTNDNFSTSSKVFIPLINNQLGNNIEIKSVYPSVVNFVFDQKIVKSVAIKPILELSFRQQFKQFGNIVVKPAVTKISGPKSILDTIDFIYTEKQVFNDLSENFTVKVEFKKMYAENQISFLPNKALIYIPVEKFTESSINVDVNYKNVPDSIELKAIPSSVAVKFLLPLSKIASLPRAVFKAQVDYNLINTYTNQKLKVILTNYPDYIQIVSINPSKVEYIIKKK